MSSPCLPGGTEVCSGNSGVVLGGTPQFLTVREASRCPARVLRTHWVPGDAGLKKWPKPCEAWEATDSTPRLL